MGMSKFTPEQKKAYAKQKQSEQRQMLADAITNLCSSEGWQQYLDARSKFTHYSFRNRILVALQKPDATMVGGQVKWNKEFGRRVREDQFKSQAILILAPQIIYLKENGKIVEKDGKKIIDRIWYKTVEVYDVSQTEGDPIPGPAVEPITGHSHDEYLMRMEQYAKSLGLGVEYADPESEHQENVIKIDYNLEINGRVRQMVRELAFAMKADLSDYTYAEREVITESVAYLTTQAIGLDTSGMSVPHIATWGSVTDESGMKDALTTVTNFATKIDEITDTLVEAIS